jgi:hypothetical protein
MNVEIGTEAAQFPEKEYINGIFVAVLNAVRRKRKISDCRLIKLKLSLPLSQL